MGARAWAEGALAVAVGAGAIGAARVLGSILVGVGAHPAVAGVGAFALGLGLAAILARRVGQAVWALPLIAALVAGLGADVARGAARRGAVMTASEPMPDAAFAAVDPSLPAVHGPVEGVERWVETMGGGVGGRTTRERVTRCTLRAVGPLADGDVVWLAAVHTDGTPDLAENGPRLYAREPDFASLESCVDAMAALDPASRAALQAVPERRWLQTDDPAEGTPLNDTGKNASWVLGVLWTLAAAYGVVRRD
jgi:hypothetical protein